MLSWQVVTASSCLILLVCFFATQYSVYTWRGKLPAMSLSHNTLLVNSTGVNLGWYAPSQSVVNNLSSTINGTGVHGFIFNGSTTPASVPYPTYNWCNMPHVRRQEYVVVPSEYKLEYVELIHRHHKRTPYPSNTFLHETYPWYCDDETLFYYGAPQTQGNAAAINWKVTYASANPLTVSGFNGSCQFPQITSGGLADSRQHGSDLFGVYHDLLHFLPATFDVTKISYRVTNNVITSQVASQVILGMYPSNNHAPTQVSIQPASIDSLEPTYTCSAASALYSSYGVGSSNTSWMAHLNASKRLFAKLDSVSGVSSSDAGWHNWFDHYFDNLSSRLCHAKLLPCNATNSSLCVSQADADAVFRAGEYEYSFIYRDSPQSLNASVASYGIWMAELAANLRSAIAGKSQIIYRHNIAHDGSLSRLLSILQVDVMVWPGMGSEVVFELYSKTNGWCLRVLWGGQVLKSSNPGFGSIDLIDVEILLAYIDGLVGVNASKIMGLCSTEQNDHECCV